MTFIRLIGILALFAVAVVPASAQQQKHWLIGTWKGELGNVATTTRYGSERTLIVNKVAADGSSAKANWAGQGKGEGEGGTVTLTISGDQVSFMTSGSQGNSYKLTHKGDSLEGDWQRSGAAKGGAVFLKKQ